MYRTLLASFLSLACSVLNASDMKISDTKVIQAANATGIGKADAPLLYVVLNVDGDGDTLCLDGIRLSLNGTSASADIDCLKLYSANSSMDFSLESSDVCKLASYDVSRKLSLNEEFEIRLSDTPFRLNKGLNRFWLVADVSKKAREGHTIEAEITGYYVHTVGGNTSNFIPEKAGRPRYGTQIFLTESCLSVPWTDDSHYWRIPAIASAAKGRLVAVMDKRWDSNYDLPNKIDVVTCYSDDKGRTWSPRQTIAGTTELGGEYGHGDPGILYNRQNGDLVVIVVAKRGFFDSAPDDNARIKLIISHDNGETWETPRDITDQLYGSGCSDPVRSKWHGAFAASGAMMQTSNGRLMTVLCVCETEKNYITNYVAYSDDNGENWIVCPDVVAVGGDESKVVELADGRIMVSVRHRGGRFFNIATVDAAGNLHFGKQELCTQLLEPACNGDFIRYSLQKDGARRNRLLHTICHDAKERRNVSVFLSYDEGMTWTQAFKPLCPRGSAYSALTVLDDGTIGCFYEEETERENGYDGYTLRFIRFSLPWLTDNNDSEKKSLFRKR